MHLFASELLRAGELQPTRAEAYAAGRFSARPHAKDVGGSDSERIARHIGEALPGADGVAKVARAVRKCLRLGGKHTAQPAGVLASRPLALADEDRLAGPPSQSDGIDFNVLWLIRPERADRDDAFSQLAGFGKPPKMEPECLFVLLPKVIVQVGDEDREDRSSEPAVDLGPVPT
jgi:hypothetical protein